MQFFVHFFCCKHRVSSSKQSIKKIFPTHFSREKGLLYIFSKNKSKLSEFGRGKNHTGPKTNLALSCILYIEKNTKQEECDPKSKWTWQYHRENISKDRFDPFIIFIWYLTSQSSVFVRPEPSAGSPINISCLHRLE